ncbi:dienelactone hydrolase [Paraburkholderia rhizosphaerae]|uniref:Dienelactone hydrolase n=2 Tax=Paraburkholderia rhizosphaerae TaxID=480658 RepID=A0A4R8LQU3_9BURK|nr:dienelactone hydrolase [Paraburkholderia rhizosphaerae]
MVAACAALAATVAAQAGTTTDGGPLSNATVPRIAFDDDHYLPTVHLNEQVIGIPGGPDGSITLQTTIYKPDGPGPFPLVVFNHGKIHGDPRSQARSDPVSFAREFVRRGYVVVAPNRQGFAQSGGTYVQDGCNVERNGLSQAADVASTVDFMAKQSYVDAQHIVIAGTSHGGLATIAYGADAASGVRGLINFSGGLRQDACTDWQGNLTRAFGTYGEQARVPSLWLYGDNDSIWSPELVSQMYAAYDAHAANSKMVDFGMYKNDAHRLVGDRDGVHIWWPSVERFLARIGMPTRVQYQVSEPSQPKPTDFASIDSVGSVPFIDDAGRNGYRNFLHQYPSRAFAVSASGAWSWAEGGDDPMAMAVTNCQKQSSDPCRLYAVNDTVVWKQSSSDTQTAENGNDNNNSKSDSKPALASN